MAGRFYQEKNLKAGTKKPHQNKVRLQVRLNRWINNRSLSLFSMTIRRSRHWHQSPLKGVRKEHPNLGRLPQFHRA